LRRFVLLAFLCAACSTEKAAPDSTNVQVTEGQSPDQLLLRVPRGGGSGRIYVWPKLDSVVWTIDETPAVERVLAFDPNNGTIAFVDTKGSPGRIDLREEDIGKASKAKLTSLSSANGTDIYGINAKGEVVRLNPTGGDWHFKPPVPARSVFAQPNGELIVSANRGSQTVVWKVRPPDDVIQDSTSIPLSGRAVSTQMGDRVYFTVDSGLVGVKVKDLSPAGSVNLDSRIRALAPTPSGDRLYVATAADSGISVVDRYSGDVQTAVVLAAPPGDLRMDPLGRYLIARFPKGDSAWIVNIGNNRLLGAVQTKWAADLPAITPDGALAALGDKDVSLLDPEKLTVKSTVAGGAKDFWYFFTWDGFRPRARGLDQPVTFPGDFNGDSLTASSTASSTIETSPHDTAAAAPAPAAAGFVLSFATLLAEDKAQDMASRIIVGGRSAHVVAATAGGAPVYRVVMGPFSTREEADRVGRASRRDYWIYEGSP